MSDVTSLFFNCEDDLNTVAGLVSKITSSELALKELDIGTIYTTDILGFLITLYRDHDLENDYGIDFESYTYELDIENNSSSDTTISIKFMEYLTLYLHEELQRRYNIESLPIKNLAINLMPP